jgi:DNA polymerase-3 subunit epsilon
MTVLIIDTETTGIDPERDQVIELGVQLGLTTPWAHNRRTWRFKPSIPIPEEASAVHGITDADVADCPRFADHADNLRAFIENGSVLVGYNVQFDIDMLQAEYRRLAQAPLDLDGKHIIDALALWRQCEPRTLQDAHKRFVGDSFEGAHGALADVAATGRVLLGMLTSFELNVPDAPDAWAKLAVVCEPERARWIGPSRHIQWDDKERVVLGFGKHAGIDLAALARSKPSYLRWILGGSFPAHVKDACGVAIRDPSAVVGYLREIWGGAPEGNAQ